MRAGDGPIKAKNKKLVVIGAGEQAHMAYEYFTYDSEYEIAAFSVDREYANAETFQNLPLVPFDQINKLYPPSEYWMFVAIPSSQLNKLRTRFYLAGKEMGYRFASYVSSHAFVWRNVEIGENCFIFEDNTLQPFVKIGDNCVLWSGNHVGHRSVIKDHCFVTSHVVISGFCEIGESCFLGVNSTINDNTKIAPRCIVGSGSLVVKNLTEADSVYVGTPAKLVPGRKSSDVKL